MGKIVRLTAADGHRLDAWRAEPAGVPAGGLVVVQEIFGLTLNIRHVCDAFAQAGYLAIAPAMFDRLERDLVLDYQDVATARGYMQQLAWPDTLCDIESALQEARGAGFSAVVGFCWGGTVAHVAAADLEVDAAVSYYGTRVARFLDRKPRCPVMYHFGDQDAAIPPADVDAIRQAMPDAGLHLYAGAGHGFACADRRSYHQAHARLAFERTLVFLATARAERG
jgi:carboxymethylenebutenolidase